MPIVSIVILTAVAANADIQPVLWSSGDLGYNIIDNAGDFRLFPVLENASNTLPAELTVKYGQWNDPDILVDVYFNAVLVGDFFASEGYRSPGPKYVSFDVTGLITDDTPEILFTGHGANAGDYVVGQVDLHYNIPEPCTLLLLGLGGPMLRKRRQA